MVILVGDKLTLEKACISDEINEALIAYIVFPLGLDTQGVKGSSQKVIVRHRVGWLSPGKALNSLGIMAKWTDDCFKLFGHP